MVMLIPMDFTSHSTSFLVELYTKQYQMAEILTEFPAIHDHS